MKVLEITGHRYMGFEDFSIQFPETGLVLITGMNGEGKSGIVEATPAAAWNKTLRGTPWWNSGEESTVTVRTDTWSVQRTRTAGDRNKMLVEGRQRYETAAKALEVFEKEIPSFDTWRKTSVFSGSAVEGKPVGMMSDGDIKRLIETVLGLDRFDPASKQVRKDLRVLEEELKDLRHERELLQIKFDNEEQRADDAADQMRAMKMPDNFVSSEEVTKLEAQLRTLKNDLAGARSSGRQKLAAGAQYEQEIRGLLTQSQKLKDDKCPTCSQAIPQKMRDDLAKLVSKAEKKLAGVKEEASKELGLIDATIEELEEEIEFYQSKYAEARASEGSLDAYREAKQQLETVIRDAKLASTKHMVSRGDVTNRMRDHFAKILNLKAVDSALGLKGVRAHILGGMLTGLEEISNYWLDRMPWRDQTMQVTLRPFKEKAAGGMSDAIDIQINGAGGGFGYKALSQGQRRRVDVALLIGLAKISHAAHGLSDGTIFFDEVFDPLDSIGIDAVAEALIDLAQDRCVVVISHSKHLQEVLQPTVHFEVDHGNVFEL